MKRIRPSQLPSQRTHDLVVHDLPDEVLVYDRRTDQAHCLNHTAALVWRACDGASTTNEIARKLTAKLDRPISEDLVLLALDQLDKFQLLETSTFSGVRLAALTRRQMVRTLGIAAAVAVPLVTSIIAPTPAQAATCIAAGQPCSPTIFCCSPLGCNPPSGKCRP
jgi:Coenzyme PQQ synthesis protein D (PqqD)